MLKITKQQIEEIIKLLPKEYHNYKVKVHYNKFLYWLKEPFNSNNYDGVRAEYNRISNKINILFFKYEKIPLKETKFNICISNLESVYCLIHELRHYYQATQEFDKFKAEFVNYVNLCKEGKYNDLEIEKDANRYARYFMNTHREDIDRILKTYIIWNAK